MDCVFNEDYYERGIETGVSGYSNFRWIPDLTLPLCFQMIELLNIRPNDTVLDFGCAKGYIVKGLRMLYRQAWGMDCSTYAISQAPADVRDYLFEVPVGDDIPLVNDLPYRWIIAKDVLEHVPYEGLDALLAQMRCASIGMFVVVPLGTDGKFVIPAYEGDVTHIIREPLDWWSDKFTAQGFLVQAAEYKMEHIKENWAQWDYGNGFFILG